MSGRRIKLILNCVIAFSTLALLAAASVSLIVARRNAPQARNAAQMLSVTRNGRTVTFVECQRCEKILRVAPDGMSATINLCRLRDDNPDAEEFARRRDALVEKAFMLMVDKEAVRHMETDKVTDK